MINSGVKVFIELTDYLLETLLVFILKNPKLIKN